MGTREKGTKCESTGNHEGAVYNTHFVVIGTKLITTQTNELKSC